VLLVAVVVLEFGSDNSFLRLHWNPTDKLHTNRRLQGHFKFRFRNNLFTRFYYNLCEN